GRDVSGPEYVGAWAKLELARQEYDYATAGYDAIIAPTAPILPPNLARLIAEPEYYVTENLMALRNTRIGNLLGLCALTLPTGTPSCGLMLMAAPDFDNALLRLGAAAEAALA
ncbi:MAG: amidase, partial [Sulfitobacter sp.]